uniref:Protein kinase domain-containing protein n=1 Tax=Macrostomum lignano TaxID=282301 RepID=A0A1I8FRA1_9PLAT
VSCLHDYEHWLRMHSCKMREQFSNPPSRNPTFWATGWRNCSARAPLAWCFWPVARETKESYAIKVFNKHRVHNACSAYSLVDSFQCSQNLYVVTDFMECGCLHDHLRLKKTFRYEEPWATIGYIAPEIIMRKPYNFAVDWYSLGVIIFELLVGIGPECYRRERCPEPSSSRFVFPPEINAVCVDLVRRLLMRNPSFRWVILRTKVHEVRHHPFFRDVDFYRPVESNCSAN